LAWAKKLDPNSRITREKRDGGIANTEEHLTSKPKAISSSLGIKKN
jgi:hypothetical protein